MDNIPYTPYGPLLTAMVTPFAPDGEVDYPRAEQLAQRLLENGSTGLVVAGTTGESPTLTPAEKLELFRRIKRAAGQRPVVAGTGDNETAFSIEFSRQAAQAGVDALLLVVPYYNRPSQEGLYRHFKAIAEAVELPCILYNIPGRTSRNMEPATVARLSEVRNIVGIKEACGDMTQVARLKAAVPDDFFIYSGNDSDTLPMLPLGACGCISVISHIAGRPYREMLDAFWKGDHAAARRLHLRLLPVGDALFPPTTPSPEPIKAALAMQGFDCGGLRLPLLALPERERGTLRDSMARAELL